MIVLDASAAIEWLLQTAVGKKIENRIYSHPETLHAPHLLDLEVAQVLRRLTDQESITSQRAGEAIGDLLDLRVRRYPHSLFLPRIWQLRYSFSAYDAAYVTLAEQLGATLLTLDGRLASAANRMIRLEVFS